jgi:hypothetical protein
MRHWWVNQNQTYRHEVLGGYLWSPKRNVNGARNPFYESMGDIAPAEREGIVSRMEDHYETKLSELDVKFDPKRLREIVGIYYPDFRTIANTFQLEFGLS